MGEAAVLDPPVVKPEAETTVLTEKPVEKAAEKPTEKPVEKPAVTPEKPVVPEKYELKLPKDSFLDPSHVERTASYAKERGLSNEQAQAILDREHAAVSGFIESANAKVKAWAEEAKADKEIGGDDFGKNIELAKRVLDRFGTPEFKEALNKTGLGNHKELLRVFVRIGKASADDKMINPGAQTPVKRAPEDQFYGSKQAENKE